MRALLLLAALVMSAPAQAQNAAPSATSGASTPAPLDPTLSPGELQRLKQLSAELRCLVCQNQSLADSNAELAVDLRNQVRDQIRGGRSDEQIKEYLVQRYGDFVLYRPRVSAQTLMLWAGPFVLLALGGFAMWRYLRQRQRGGLPPPAEESLRETPADADARLALARALLRGDAAPAAAQDRPAGPADAQAQLSEKGSAR